MRLAVFPQIETSSYFILISSFINMIFSFVLVIFLIFNFVRKKTVGTFMLLSAYLYFTITSAVSIVYRLMFILNQGEVTLAIYTIAAIGPLILLPAFAYLYIFACRHILKDNEILRINIFSIIMFFFGVAVSIVAYDIFFQTPNFAEIFGPAQLEFTEAVLVTPDVFTVSYSLFIMLFQVGVSIYVTGRVGWRALRLARKSDQLVRKRGLQIIGLGVLMYLFGGMLSAFDSSLAAIPGLMITVAVFRAFAFATAYVAMYIGWIMPNWFRKMIRKRSWFELQYNQMVSSDTV
jgi:hypothetical protein